MATTGVFLPTVLLNPTIETNPPATRFGNYVSGGAVPPAYFYEIGDYISTPVIVDGNTLYRVECNMSMNPNYGSTPEDRVTSMAFNLPFVSYYDNQFCVCSMYNTTYGGITVPMYVNAGQLTAIVKVTAVDSIGTLWQVTPTWDIYSFHFVYYTPTPPS